MELQEAAGEVCRNSGSVAQGWLAPGLAASRESEIRKKRASAALSFLVQREEGSLRQAEPTVGTGAGGLCLPSHPFPAVSPEHSSSRRAASVMPQQQGLYSSTHICYLVYHMPFFRSSKFLILQVRGFTLFVLWLRQPEGSFGLLAKRIGAAVI